jgi:hypothetical protein
LAFVVPANLPRNHANATEELRLHPLVERILRTARPCAVPCVAVITAHVVEPTLDVVMLKLAFATAMPVSFGVPGGSVTVGGTEADPMLAS